MQGGGMRAIPVWSVLGQAIRDLQPWCIAGRVMAFMRHEPLAEPAQCC